MNISFSALLMSESFKWLYFLLFWVSTHSNRECSYILLLFYIWLSFRIRSKAQVTSWKYGIRQFHWGILINLTTHRDWLHQKVGLCPWGVNLACWQEVWRIILLLIYHFICKIAALRSLTFDACAKLALLKLLWLTLSEWSVVESAYRISSVRYSCMLFRMMMPVSLFNLLLWVHYE
jgi:hypothetical protein